MQVPPEPRAAMLPGSTGRLDSGAIGQSSGGVVQPSWESETVLPCRGFALGQAVTSHRRAACFEWDRRRVNTKRATSDKSARSAMRARGQSMEYASTPFELNEPGNRAL